MQFSTRNPYKKYKIFKQFLKWGNRGFSAPAPQFVKQIVLKRNGISSATWVETGTYLGQTTEFLAQDALQVYSLEPEPTLFKNAYTYFQDKMNVEIIHGPSEEVFPELLKKLQGNVCFWLDGHYSGGGTFKGAFDTPILNELSMIANHLEQFNQVVVMIDDVRLFNGDVHANEFYPSLNKLVEWSNKHHLTWHIEHDIFVAKLIKKLFIQNEQPLTIID
jgi:hypothetical protein